jgi:hypothetical protein
VGIGSTSSDLSLRAFPGTGDLMNYEVKEDTVHPLEAFDSSYHPLAFCDTSLIGQPTYPEHHIEYDESPLAEAQADICILKQPLPHHPCLFNACRGPQLS